MSLVEQAIARLKHQARASVAGSADVSANGTVPVPIAERLKDSASLAKQITVDNTILRAGGYLPEQGQERQFADQYRRIKRPLIDKAISGDAPVAESRVILVTSALPGEGKTFTSINLALSMALERDISVLLVDADVSKRRISEIFELNQQTGLLDALVDEKLDAESVIVPTTTRGLSILPAGRRVPNTAELLSSNRMRKIVTSLNARNPRRILLVDSPPLLVTNEGRTLVKLAGQVILVVRAGQTPRQAVQAAEALFEPQQAGGVVLNEVPASSTEGYYGYGSYGTDGAQT
ncbi:MAG TPA: AAA family ATPase [Steroidobacteraceae bacterium]|nr:AAA family ATPase [Steroidobacteraceae bacterium]